MTPSPPVSPRRIEEASINAWPALREVLLDGWLLRFAGGFTKRANSIVPLYPPERDNAEKVRYCENLYAREQLQTIFRLTSIEASAGLDELLATRGYRHCEPSHVLIARNAPEPKESKPTIRLCRREHWLDAYASLTHLPEVVQPLHDAILKGIQTECAFALIEVDGKPAACGLGVLEENLLGLFDVFTDSELRRTGLGRALVSQLMQWGAERGASWSYLQVSADNKVAQALYAGLGFSISHQYWYRISG